MDGHRDGPMKLPQLPVELLHDIFFHAQNPFLAHVCRKLWRVLPGFVSYSRALAQHAFGVDIHLDSEMLDRFYYQPMQPRWLDFKNAIHSSLDPQRCRMQELMCAQWLTVGHLRKIRRWNIWAGVKAVYQIARADFSHADQRHLDQFLQKMESEPFTFIRTTPVYGHMRQASRYWIRSLTGKGGRLKIFVSSDHFELMPIEDSKIGLVLLPFLPADRIPQQLFRQIARFDVRSQELAEELAWTRIHEWKYGCPWARSGNDDIFGPQGRQVLRQCIVEILDSVNVACQSSIHPTDHVVQKCMRTLLGFDSVMFRAEAVTFSWRDTTPKQYLTMPMLQLSTTLAKDRPVHIKSWYYEHCFRTHNTAGLKLLVHLNHAMYNPDLAELKEMMSCHLSRRLYSDLSSDACIHGVELQSMIKEAERQGEQEWKQMLNLLEEAPRKAQETLRDQANGSHQTTRHIVPAQKMEESRKHEGDRLAQWSNPRLKSRTFGLK